MSYRCPNCQSDLAEPTAHPDPIRTHTRVETRCFCGAIIGWEMSRPQKRCVTCGAEQVGIFETKREPVGWRMGQVAT